MYEIALLDQLESLNTRYPRLDVSNLTMKTLFSSDAATVGSLGETIMLTRGSLLYAFSPDNTKVYASSNAGNSPYKCLIIDLAAETVAFDDSVGRSLYPVVPDSSGAVWASGNRASYYGLWKRTGPATWTNTLSDAAAGALKYKPDGTLYYLSSTNNWYLLSGGTATLVGAPVGYLTIPTTQYLEFPTAELRPNADFADATGAVIANLGTLDFSVASPASGWFYQPTAQGKRQVRIDNTYSLVVWQPAATSGSLYPKEYLFLVNKVTQAQKYIGSINCPTLNYIAAMVNQTAFDLAPFFAKLENGFLKIYWLGVLAQGSGAGSTTSNLFGLLRTNIPYTPDF